MSLTELGWNEHFEQHRPEGELVLGRVAVEHRGAYAVYTEGGEAWGEVAGKLRYEAAGRDELPAVGDWVAMQPRPGGPRDDPRRPAAPHQDLAQGEPQRDRGAGARGERRHDLPRQLAEPRPESAPHRALPRDGLGERRRAGGRPEQGRPLSDRGAWRPDRRGRGDRLRRPRPHCQRVYSRGSRRADAVLRARPDGACCSARRASASRR